ncbi:unnamed protein product [Cylindrotheca closterium]|uniref:RNI-like protein n=1 Tax=Cylindrotheca closterium TaxID=2856 RepID=A0AAD2JL34_9STRA|nr:unnamed protein product [Cylindrotheca closterium]
MGKPLVLDGSSNCRLVAESIQAAIEDPHIDRLIVSGIDLECEIASSLLVLFKHRIHPWAEIVVRKCIGPIHGLLTLILEESKASVDVLQLDNTVGKLGVSGAIRRGLSKNRDLCKVKEIALTNSRLSAWIMEDLMTGICTHTGIRNLLFIACEFIPSAAAILSRGLKYSPHVQDLSLYGSKIDDYDLASVVDSCYNLTSIDLGHTDCGPKTISRLGFLLDSSRKSSNCKLTSLDINCHRHLGTSTPSGTDLTALFRGLTQNSTVKHLDITSLPLNDKSAECLVTCLHNNVTLESMVLTDCGLSQVSMTLILENLANFAGMRRLYMDGRHNLGLYGRQQWTELATEALSTRNLLLEALYLPPAFDFYRAEMDQLLDRNLAGRRILLSDGMCKTSPTLQNPSAVWSHVLERVNKVALPDGCKRNPPSKAARRADMTYYMLRQRIMLEN